VHHADGTDLLLRVRAKLVLERLRIDPVAPVAGDEIRLKTEPLGHLLPERGEVAGLEHQDAVAGGKRVRERCFPRPRSRGGIHDHRLRGAEDALQSCQDFLCQFRELRPAMIDGRPIDRA